MRLLLWPKENPFGDGAAIDGDDPAHIGWILERAQERAAEYGIAGVDYRLTQVRERECRGSGICIVSWADT